jgi:Fe-S cluster assembly protein SufD
MSLKTALARGDLSELPSRRDEDWRWSDLRGLIREVPRPSPSGAAPSIGPFAAVASGALLFVNGHRVDETATNGPGGAIGLRFVSTADHTAHSVDQALVFPAGSKTVVLESYEGSGEGYVANVALEFELEGDAQVERIVLASDNAAAIAVSQATVRLSAASRFSQTVLTTGAKRQRLETSLVHPGGATVRLDGVYLVGGREHADITTVVTHEGLGGTTMELTKGAVAGQGRAVFQGRIVVSPGADQTDARMGHHALILSDRGEVDAKPELLIYADDVSCAHGNTVGALDQDALFYARQRGIPEAQAKAMLTEAFIGEVIDRIEHDGAREVCRAWAAEKLQALA